MTSWGCAMIVCINYKKVKVRLFPTKKIFSNFKQTVMSNTPLPSVEEVNKWKRNDVTKFLQDKKEELDLDNEDIDIFQKKKVAGRDFLSLTLETLTQKDGLFVLSYGPAKRITSLVNDIKGKGQCRCHYCIQIL